jgi:hypothetical protein
MESCRLSLLVRAGTSARRTIASARLKKSLKSQDDVVFIRVTGALMAAAMVCLGVLQLACCQKSIRLAIILVVH